MIVKEALTPTERQALMDDFLQTLLDIARTPTELPLCGCVARGTGCWGKEGADYGGVTCERELIKAQDIRDTFTDEEVCQELEERISDQTGFAE